MSDDTEKSLLKGAAIVFGAAAVGLIFGIAIEAYGRVNGRPRMGAGFLRYAKQAVAGFALGTVTAATFQTITRNGEIKRE